MDKIDIFVKQYFKIKKGRLQQMHPILKKLPWSLDIWVINVFSTNIPFI